MTNLNHDNAFTLLVEALFFPLLGSENHITTFSTSCLSCQEMQS